jgi:hypothetical protein
MNYLSELKVEEIHELSSDGMAHPFLSGFLVPRGDGNCPEPCLLSVCLLSNLLGSHGNKEAKRGEESKTKGWFVLNGYVAGISESIDTSQKSDRWDIEIPRRAKDTI